MLYQNMQTRESWTFGVTYKACAEAAPKYITETPPDTQTKSTDHYIFVQTPPKRKTPTRVRH